MIFTIDLSDKKEETLRAKAEDMGLSPEHYARELLERQLGEFDAAMEEEADNRPLSEIIAEIMSDVPREELDRLPKDGAAQHDHYIYGWPKKHP